MTAVTMARAVNSAATDFRFESVPQKNQLRPDAFARSRPLAAAKDGQYGRAYEPQQQWARQTQPQYQPQYQHYPYHQQNYQYQPTLQPQYYQNSQQHAAPNQLQHAHDPYSAYRNASSGLSPIMQGLWSQQPAMRTKVEVAGLIVDALRRNGVDPRIGGSLAARAYGGIRDPRDIDIEVSSAQDLGIAYAALMGLNSVATLPSGEQVHVQGFQGRHATEGRSAQVNIAMTRQNGEQVVVGADIVNENFPGITPNLLPASQRGIGVAPGNMIAPHLVAGFLSRYIRDPEFSAKKQDAHQIAALIRNAGIDPNSQIAYFDLASAIGEQFTPDQKALASQKFREILTMMTMGYL